MTNPQDPALPPPDEQIRIGIEADMAELEKFGPPGMEAKMPNAVDACANCGHERSLHHDAVGAGDYVGCHYCHPHSGACGSNGGQPPYGNGNTSRCLAFVDRHE